MYAFKINGGRKLSGTVQVKGAKNAILPLMAAALLTDEPVILHNVSYLSDNSHFNWCEVTPHHGFDLHSSGD